MVSHGRVGYWSQCWAGGREGLVALGLKLLSGAWPSRTVRWGSKEPGLQRDKNIQARCKWKNVHKEKYCVCWHVSEVSACDLDYPGDGFQIHLLIVELTSPHNLCSDAVLCLWLPMSAAGEIVPWAVPHPSTTGLSYLFVNYLWISPSRGLGGPSAWLPVHTSGRNSPSAGLSVLDLESLPLLPKI